MSKLTGDRLNFFGNKNVYCIYLPQGISFDMKALKMLVSEKMQSYRPMANFIYPSYL